MEEIKRISKPIYYNVPQLKGSYESPAVAVGIVVTQGREDTIAVRIVIRRELSVRLSSFTVLCRFSDGTTENENEDNRFSRVVYEKQDLNSREYLNIVLGIPANRVKGGCTALVSDVIFENGRQVSYRISDYDAPAHATVGDLKTVSPQFRRYLEAVAAKERANSTKESAETAKARPTPPPVKRKIRKNRRSFLGSPGGVLILVLVIAAAVAVTASVLSSKEEAPQPPADPVETGLSEKELSELLAMRDFSEAYHLVSLYGEETELQAVCEQAVQHYRSVLDFDRAYLYAAAAPVAMVEEVLDSFVDYFVTAGRYDEAYAFLTEHGDCNDALQTLCAAAVEQYLEESDFENAYFYAMAAPQTLENAVFSAAEACLVQEGNINPAALAILQKNDDEGELDSLISETVPSLEDFDTAYSMAISIKDETIRSKTVLNVCIGRMKALVDENDLSGAYALYSDAEGYLKDKQKKECLTRMISYSTMQKNTAGTVFFRNLSGEDTSSIVVEAEDFSVRENLEEVYFLLSEKQKRDYHAVCFDLYKEAYFIQAGALAGTEITDAVSVSTFEYQTIVLLADGTVTALENEGHNLVLEMPSRKDIVQIAAGQNHAVFLHNDGTVSGSGSNSKGQLEVTAWSNVTKVVSGADFTVGLLADGTLVACGSNKSGQCNVADYTRVLDIAACDQSLVLLFRDGSVKVVGDVSLGLKRADYFNNIKRIRAAASCIIAETKKGTFVMAHEVTNADIGSVIRWNNVRWFAAGSLFIGNVDTYGRINIEGDGVPVQWE